MIKYYPKAKCDILINKFTAQEMFKQDKLFPNDAEERSFPIVAEQAWTNATTRKDTITAIGKLECDDETQQALLGEGGLLGNETHVGIPGLSDGGIQSFMQTFEVGIDTDKLDL